MKLLSSELKSRKNIKLSATGTAEIQSGNGSKEQLEYSFYGPINGHHNPDAITSSLLEDTQKKHYSCPPARDPTLCQMIPWFHNSTVAAMKSDSRMFLKTIPPRSVL